MRASVVEMFVRGVQRTAAEVESSIAVTGELLVTRQPRGLIAPLAQLLQIVGTGTGGYRTARAALLNPLFEPVAHISERRFYLTGTQYADNGDGTQARYMQAWWVRFE